MALGNFDQIVFAPSAVTDVGLLNTTDDSFELLSYEGHQHTDAFWGMASTTSTTNGEVVFVPFSADRIMVYVTTSVPVAPEGGDNIYSHAFEFTADYSHEQLAATTATQQFAGAAVANNGKVVFAPFNSYAVGLYDSSNESFALHDISDTVAGMAKFDGAVHADNGNIIFAPFSADGPFQPINYELQYP